MPHIYTKYLLEPFHKIIGDALHTYNILYGYIYSELAISHLNAISGFIVIRKDGSQIEIWYGIIIRSSNII